MVTFKGYNGEITLLDNKIVITKGRFSGNCETTIALIDIISVKYKKSGLSRSHLEIVTAGDKNEHVNIVQQPNVVLLHAGQDDEALNFKELIEKRISEARKSGDKTVNSQTAFSVADEIRKFKSLLDDGIITQDEFNSMKNQLLNLGSEHNQEQKATEPKPIEKVPDIPIVTDSVNMGQRPTEGFAQIKCPKCKKVQSADRSTCFNCGINFIFDGVEQVETQKPEQSEPEKKTVYIPDRIGDCIKLYYYPKVNFLPYPKTERLVLAMQESGEWEVTLKYEDSKIIAYYHEDQFGELLEKADMVSDWLKRNDPMFCVLGNFGGSENYLAIAFYRDEQKRLSSRESTVVKLTHCTNDDAQLNMIGLEDGDKLELEENYEQEDSVNVLFDGCEIGALPKKQAVRFLDEGCTGVFLDHIYNDDNCNNIPFVKIYW